MPAILAIDSSTPVAGFALLIDGRPILVRTAHSPDGHAHKLFAEIDALLAEAAITVAEIDCFAAASGPGSFTGVRIALAAVKGLAHATGRPVCAVSNLEALAWFGSAPLRAPVIAARANEVYAAVYDAALRVVVPEAVLSWDDFAASAGDAQIIRDSPPIAIAVAHIALDRLRAGLASDPAVPDANYIRPPAIRESAL
ncbi:MAG: tRNA (adenosine(37)-N6)-threonylcarbamoyltransferase complex dimerization subunit type 1 TsaB [Bryobacteraceae bacterium]